MRSAAVAASPKFVQEGSRWKLVYRKKILDHFGIYKNGVASTCPLILCFRES